MLDKAAKRPAGKNAKAAAANQRRIQLAVDAKDKTASQEKPKAAHLGARNYPEPPIPKQHHPKPVKEFEIEPAPLMDT
jgi:hypothetical protein